MRTIYLDSNYVCHPENAEGRMEVETDALNDVCNDALEYYRYIPASYGKSDFFQCFDSKTATAIQRQYEKMISERADMQAALDAIYGGVTDDGT